MLKIAIFKPRKMPFSVTNYLFNIIKNFPEDVKISFFYSVEDLKGLRNKVDIYWFPNCTGGSFPSIRLINLIKDKKIVVTLHGAAPFAIDPKIYYPTKTLRIKGEFYKLKQFVKWQVYKNRVSRIITVSNYAKEEICSKLFLPRNKVHSIYHGVNFSIFNDKKLTSVQGKYFLHISKYQPIKNVDRIIEAYMKLSNPKPKLVLISPGYQKEFRDKNIIVINTPKTHKELVPFYRNAIAFVFPSLRESFGMPILEAMACGCPVITSNTSACSEIAGNAALLINPYSEEELVDAMYKLMKDNKLRNDLSKRGKERARNFSWEKSAMNHLEVFNDVISEE